MQVRDGMWMIKDGFEILSASEIYTYKLEGHKLYIYCPFVRVERRGNTLDGGMITGEIYFTNNGPSFKFYHYNEMKKSKFETKREILADVNITEERGVLKFSAGRYSIEMQLNNCEFSILKDDIEITSIPSGSLQYVKKNRKSYMMSSLKIDVQEKIYGLGERFTEFIKNGQSVSLSNEDGGTASNQAYKNIPFAVSTKNYGVFVDHSELVEFEVGSELVGKNQFSVQGEEIRFDILLGDSIGQVVEGFSKMTGDIPCLPEWSYGLWLSSSFTTQYDEKTVLSFIDEMDERGIPFEVFHFDCFWMKEFEWMNFEWNEELFPNPQELLEKIHNRNKKVCLWINPYIGQKSSAYREAYESGFFIKREDGKPFQWDKWQAGLGVIDFTNPDAKTWYKEKLRKLVRMGVDSFKTDFGERIPIPNNFYETDVIEYFDKSDAYEMHNYYTHLYNQAVYEVLEEEHGENHACLFARSGTVGGQSFPVHWGGDCLSNYVSMAESLRGGLSLSLGGYAFWSHDIGGFEAGCNPDIYKRWTQFGLLSSHSRYHGNSEYKVPWLYGEEAVEVSKKFCKLKNSLMPYFKEMENQAVELGRPMLRPLIFDYSKDKTTHYIDTQFSLGDKIIVAPIFNDQGKVEYYLPKDYSWFNILNFDIKQGGNWYNETFDYFNLPVMLRSDAAIVIKKEDSFTSFEVGIEFKVIAFALEESKKLTVINEGEEAVIEIANSGIVDDGGLNFKLVTIDIEGNEKTYGI